MRRIHRTSPIMRSPRGVDPSFGKVVLLLQTEGSDESTNFVDRSPKPKAIAVSGGTPIISTAQSRFQGASLRLPSTLSHLSLPSAEFQFAVATPFTVEFWIWPIALPSGTATVVGLGAPGAGVGNAPVRSGWGVNLDGSGFFQFAIGDFDLSLYNAVNNTNGAVGSGIWSHVAVCTDGANTPKIFINGVSRAVSSFGAVSWASVTPTETDSTLLFVGKYDAVIGTPATLNAYIEDLRVTYGVARYSANFTPPTARYPSA